MTRSRRPHLFTPHSDLCSPTTPHRSRVTRHLPADNGWILLSDSDQSEESRGLVGLSSAGVRCVLWRWSATL